MIIGEAPGIKEGLTGKPFQGKSGRLLRALLEEYGVSKVYLTNVVKCRPPGDRKPTSEEIKACSKYLQEEFETLRPRNVLLLGAVAMKSVIRKTKVTEMCGQIVEREGTSYVCSFHPDAVLRDPSKMGYLRMAIQRFAKLIRGELKTEEQIDWRIIDRSSIDDFLSEWSRCEKFAFDLETTGLEWWRPEVKINCMALSLDVGGEWILPFSLTRVLRDEDLRQLLAYLAETARQKKVVAAHNGKFDNLMLMAKYGVRFPLTFDTMLADHLLDENNPHDLKSIVRRELGVRDYDISLEEKKGGGSVEKLYRYACYDARYTRLLADLFEERLKADPALHWIFYRMKMRAARAFEEIEYNGFWIDLELREKVLRDQEKQLALSERRLNALAGKRVNWNSPSQVAEILYGKLKLKPTVLTQKGSPSTGEEALLDLNHPIAKELIKYREHQKFISTYLHGWEPHRVGNHLYLGFKLHGTVTGRYSSRLHQVPRDGTIRNLFNAPPGWTHVAADYSQIELRIAAWESKDPTLIHLFQTGQDVHSATASKILGKSPESLTKEERKAAKAVNFGFIYGMSAEGFQSYAKLKYGVDVSLEESIRFRNEFFSMLSSLPKWHRKKKLLAYRDGYVRNLIGRKRNLPSIYSSDRAMKSEAERQAINSTVQGMAGDLKEMALVEIHETFSRDMLRITGEHHDSIKFWIKTEYLESILPQIKRIMEFPSLLKELGITPPIPIKVEIEVGPWGAGQKWEPKNGRQLVEDKNLAKMPQAI